MKLERILDRLINARDAALLAWNDPYLLYRLRRYKRHLMSVAWARANEYVARVPTYHDMAEGWRARAQERRNAGRVSPYDFDRKQRGSDNAQRLHDLWLEGKSNIPITVFEEEDPK